MRVDGSNLVDVMVEPQTEMRPAWRGLTHAWAFVASVPAGAVLIIAADGVGATTAAAIYIASLVTALGTSAAYHRLARTQRARAVMQRLDHSTIYLLIAGTYVPFCLIAVPLSWGIPMLALVGSIAVIGVTLKLAAFGRAPRLQYALYPLMGWAAVVMIPVLVRHVSIGQVALIITGGLAYTIGFGVLLLRRPDPWPHIFGYHEVWHGFTLVAAGLHFVAVATMVS